MRVTLLSEPHSIPAEEFDGLIVTGAEHDAQERRLHGPMLLLSLDDRPVALAAFTKQNRDFVVNECALVRKLGGDEEIAELVVDGLETVALASGATSLVIHTASRSLRRVVRLIGYVPKATADRIGFERRFHA